MLQSLLAWRGSFLLFSDIRLRKRQPQPPQRQGELGPLLAPKHNWTHGAPPRLRPSRLVRSPCVTSLRFRPPRILTADFETRNSSGSLGRVAFGHRAGLGDAGTIVPPIRQTPCRPGMRWGQASLASRRRHADREGDPAGEPICARAVYRPFLEPRMIAAALS
jgi:hypothetical protein